MVSYSTMAANGRDAAHATNTGFKLRTAAKVRTGTRAMFPARSSTESPYAELLGECGHVIEWRFNAPDWQLDHWQRMIAEGKRRRCHHCPITDADRKPVPPDHCQYLIPTERGDRICATRARFVTTEWSGHDGEDGVAFGVMIPNGQTSASADLCTRHHNYLLTEGYIDHPGHRYTTAELTANAAYRASLIKLHEAQVALASGLSDRFSDAEATSEASGNVDGGTSTTAAKRSHLRLVRQTTRHDPSRSNSQCFTEDGRTKQ